MSSPEVSLEEVLSRLFYDFTWLRAKYKIYRQLFLESQERIDFLLEQAYGVFIITEASLLNDIVVSISRMMESAGAHKHDKRQVLCIEQLVNRLELAGRTDLARKTQKELGQLRKKIGPVWAIRNKLVAHKNLRTALQRDAKPIAQIPQRDVELILDGIEKVLTIVGDDLGQHYSPEYIQLQGDGHSLVRLLEECQERREKWLDSLGQA